MSTTTDLRTLAATVVRDADTDLAAVFGQLAEDGRFARANGTPVRVVDDSQVPVRRVLAGVSSFRHDIIEQLVGEDRAALRRRPRERLQRRFGGSRRREVRGRRRAVERSYAPRTLGAEK
jgi:hypothetical protein